MKIVAFCLKCDRSRVHDVGTKRTTCRICNSVRSMPAKPLILNRGHVRKKCNSCKMECSHQLIDQSLQCVLCGVVTGVPHDL